LLDLSETKNPPYKIEIDNQINGNATILVLQLGEMTYENFAIQSILDKILSTAFFDTLRTKQQTGYFNRSWAQEHENQLMIFFGVQSTTHGSQELLTRFELFLEDFHQKCQEYIPESRFLAVKNALKLLYQHPSENLQAKSRELDLLAFTKNEDFLRKAKIIEAMNHLTYETFLETTQNFLSRKNPNRLAILVKSKKDESFQYTPFPAS